MSGPTINTEKIHKSILNLGWNGMCPTETVHLDKVFQRSACQSLCTSVWMHARHALRFGRGGQGREHTQLRGGVYRFNKALGISWAPLPRLCLPFFPNLRGFLYISLSFGFYKFFFFLDLGCCQAGVVVWKKRCPKLKTIVGKSELMWCCLCLFFYRNGLRIESLVKNSMKNVGLFSVFKSNNRISMTLWPCPACFLWWWKNRDSSYKKSTQSFYK